MTKRIIKPNKTITPCDIIENKIRFIKDGQKVGMSNILAEYKKCDGVKSFTNEQFQKIKIQEICNIWNSSTEADIIHCNVIGGKNIKLIDNLGNIIRCNTLNGYYRFVVYHEPTNTRISFDLIITKPGECYEPRGFHKCRQYICFVDTRRAFLSDDDTSGFYARIKSYLKKEGLIL